MRFVQNPPRRPVGVFRVRQGSVLVLVALSPVTGSSSFNSSNSQPLFPLREFRPLVLAKLWHSRCPCPALQRW